MAPELATPGDDGGTAPRRIVVGVDGSDSSKSALAWAVRQAQLTGAPLLAVTSWEYPSAYGYTMILPDGIDFAGDAKGILDHLTEEALGAAGDPPVTLTKSVVEGRPALVLMDLAEEAGLLVVGSRGHGEFSGMLIGSVSAHLAAHSPCPVVIVRDNATSSGGI